MNRAQRREHGHLLDRVCPRCRTRLRVIGGDDPVVAIELRVQPPRASFHAICDDCGRVEWTPTETVRTEYPRISLERDYFAPLVLDAEAMRYIRETWL